MPAVFTPEDGTGLTDANSLTTVEFADQYFLDRGDTVWAALTTDQKQVNLVKATDYIEMVNADKWRGYEQFPENPQALSFPRLGIGWDDEVPTGIQRACAEYALRAQDGPLAPDPVSVDSTGQSVELKREKVGPIEEETRYTAGGAVKLLKPYPAADMLIRPFTVRWGGGLIRA